MNPEGGIAWYSSNGPEIDVSAPSGYNAESCAGDIVSTDLAGSPGCASSPVGDSDYRSFSGTSAAAPQAAGVAALILAREPGLTQDVVRQRICASADVWGPSYQFGCGKLNAFRALQGFPLTPIIGAPNSVRKAHQCRWIASVTGGIPPYSYAWTVNGRSQGYNQPFLDYAYYGTGSSFTIRVTVTDSFLHANSAQSPPKTVAVSPTAPACGPV